MNKNPALVCIGAAHWDLIAQTGSELFPGADVPGRVFRRPGGVAGNVALALGGMGMQPKLVASIARDGPGNELIRTLNASGVDCTFINRDAPYTDSYLAIEATDGSLHAAVADCRGLEHLGTDILSPLFAAQADELELSRIVLDGNLSAEVILRVADSAIAQTARITLLAASPAKTVSASRVVHRANTDIYLNLHEAEIVCGATFDGSRDAATALIRLGFASAVVTNGQEEASAAASDGNVSAMPQRVSIKSVTGAGDIFAAAHICALERGNTADASLHFALQAAAGHISKETK